MARTMVIAIGVGIAVAAIVGIGIGISMQSENGIPPKNIVQGGSENMTQGKHLEVNLGESIGVGDQQPP